MNSREELIKYISRVCNIPAQEITLEMDLYSSCAISSLNLLDIITFAENNYNILINPEELNEDNLKDLQSFINFIEAKKDAGKL